MWVVHKIILAGPPASGKGTQCSKLVEKLGVIHISTGDLLRAEVEECTTRGIEAKEYMDKGMLVPDHLLLDIVQDRLSTFKTVEQYCLYMLPSISRSFVIVSIRTLCFCYLSSTQSHHSFISLWVMITTIITFIIITDVLSVSGKKEQPDCMTSGWLLDGFPRTRNQAISLQNSNILPDIFLIIDVPDDELIERVSGRILDPQTGKIYHEKYNPPPPEVKFFLPEFSFWIDGVGASDQEMSYYLLSCSVLHYKHSAEIATTF